MKSLTAQQIRNLYKQFFAKQGHMVVQSASLVPQSDPSLLWIGAGMAPLKPYFDGREIPENPRMVSSQKCIRTNDIENVGHTARHQTFFEMLGNFSFGDYFKREAIDWAWEFLTKELELDPEKLSATIYPDDEEAFNFWHEGVGLPSERIIRLEDNFWEIGEGPCGPCSEIFFDRGVEHGCGAPTCAVGCDCDRYLEIWNLVFTQYNKEADGSYTPLPKKNIDTGMGLERIVSVMQDVANNFETDLFRPIMDETANISGKTYGQDAEMDTHFKIIADHVRTVAFAIGDGVLPGNEGRNYIIRRLLRRAVRSGRKLGVDQAFMYRLAPVVADIMGDDYPEVRDKVDFITRVIRTEEERFHETLTEGELLLMDALKSLRENGGSQLSGDHAFRLYDTFGFPIDLTEEIAVEQGFSVDRNGFAALLEDQRERARSARHQSEGMNSDRGPLENLTMPSQFVGYGDFTTDSIVTALIRGGEEVSSLTAGEIGQVLLDVTPLYAESGGQVADLGMIESANGVAEVTDVQKAPHGQNVHYVKVISGQLNHGEKVSVKTDVNYRKDIVKNHTATHLLHKALREVLGDHVAQSGSRVEDARLRFDFSHFGAMTPEELALVEYKVNEAIWRDDVVAIAEMDLDEAKALGAMALFGEKYGNRVRVVKAGDYSTELCGGCHVDRTGVIGMFRILSETGVGSGVRRIEAATGRFAYDAVRKQDVILGQTAELLKSQPADVVSRVQHVLEDMRELERSLESAKDKLNHSKSVDLLQKVVDVAGVPVLSTIVTDVDMDGLRKMTDDLRANLVSHVIVLASVSGDKVQFVAAVSKDLQTRKLHAGQIVKKVAELTGGGGGGRPDMAQAGGKDVAKVESAMASVAQIIRDMAGDSSL